MLDDLNYIAQKDPTDALALAAELPKQLLYSDFEFNPTDIDQIENIVVAGMGGSALTAMICQAWWASRLGVPYEIVRGYDLPKYVGKSTLVIASSYSGNTEETVACFNQAQSLGATIVVISAGGKLKELATQHGHNFLPLPAGYQPRMTIGLSLSVFARVFEKLGLVSGVVSELEQASKLLESYTSKWSKEVKTAENPAKHLAEELMGKSMVIYAGPTLTPAAYKMKAGFNESARNVAFWNMLPEMNHQELMGWTSHPIDKPFGVIELRSSLDHERVNKRFEVMNKLLSGRMPRPFEVQVEGKNLIEQNLWAIMFGDFVSTYLGILNGVNPNTSETIEKFKKELG